MNKLTVYNDDGPPFKDKNDDGPPYNGDIRHYSDSVSSHMGQNRTGVLTEPGQFAGSYEDTHE
jgi:hypothetical protein